MSVFAKMLAEKVQSYIELRRSLGYAFKKQAATLRAFVRHVESEQLDGPLTKVMALDFVLSFAGAPNGRATRHGVLRRFCEYLAVYDARTEALDADLERCGAGLTHCGMQPPLPSNPSTGAHIDDAGRFAGEHGPTIRRSAPPGSQRCRPRRRSSTHQEDQVPQGSPGPGSHHDFDRAAPVCAPSRYSVSGGEGLRIFLSSRGNRLSSPGLHIAFNAARKLADLDNGKLMRLHDLRHRFAVTRLATWHRENADVQALLPLLATYLGHARYSDTAYYVTGTAELLGMAADRAFADGGAL
jgi:hypothetical protein